MLGASLSNSDKHTLYCTTEQKVKAGARSIVVSFRTNSQRLRRSWLDLTHVVHFPERPINAELGRPESNPYTTNVRRHIPMVQYAGGYVKQSTPLVMGRLGHGRLFHKGPAWLSCTRYLYFAGILFLHLYTSSPPLEMSNYYCPILYHFYRGINCLFGGTKVYETYRS